MALFKDLNSLNKFLQDSIKDAMKNEVAEEVIDVQKERIKEDVYDAYDPVEYVRRREHGGLLDDDNFNSEVFDEASNTTTISITNDTIAYPYIMKNGKMYDSKNKGKLLAPMIEEGGESNYDFHTDDYLSPRPFTENTVDQLDILKGHVEALKTGLKRNGIDAKDI